MKRGVGAQAGIATLAAVTTLVVVLSWQTLLEDDSQVGTQFVTGVAAITLAGVLVRGISLAWPFVLSGQLLVAMLSVHAFWGTTTLPRPSSARATVEAVSRAVDSAAVWRAPIPDSAPTVLPLLLVGALAVHVVVDLVAASLGRVALAGLPLLAAYTVPVSVLERPTPWPVFALAGAGFLGLLALDERGRLERWGRTLSAPDSRFSDRPRGTLLIAGGALALAVLVPSLLPHGPALTLPGIGGGLPGGDIRITEPTADLRRDLVLGDDVRLFRVQVPAANRAPTYVRVSVLDSFDGDAWRVGSRNRPAGQGAAGELLPDALAPTGPGEEIPWEVEVSERFASSWLPLPRNVRRVDAGSHWLYDAEVRDFKTLDPARTTAGLRYHLTEFRTAFDGRALREAGGAPQRVLDRYTVVPEQAAWVGDLAAEIAGGEATAYDQAVALQSFFQEEFRYSTERTVGHDLDALRTFLDEEGDRAGYCEQFAAAMALMVRTLGLPARVAVGFLSPERLDSETFEFSSRDLHAWPEIYFPGSGWVMFEPTPTTHTRAVPAYSRVGSGAEPSASASAAPSASPTSAGPRPDQRDPGAGSSGADEGTSVAVAWAAAALALLLVVGGLLMAPRVVRSRRRGLRLGTGRAEDAWAELRDTAIDLGVPWAHGRSPRAAGRLVGRSLGAGASDPGTSGESATALRNVVEAVETERYAPAGSATADVPVLRAAVATCTEALSAAATPQQRRRARWWPASVLRSTSGPRSSIRGAGETDRLDQSS